MVAFVHFITVTIIYGIEYNLEMCDYVAARKHQTAHWHQRLRACRQQTHNPMVYEGAAAFDQSLLSASLSESGVDVVEVRGEVRGVEEVVLGGGWLIEVGEDR